MAATEKVQQELELIERQVAEMESASPDEDTRRQIAKLQERIETLRQEMNAPPTAWQKTELARHPQRPQSLDYIERIFTDFSEIHGDRGFGDDAAIICGMARFHGDEVLIVATQKGRDMKQRVHRNFARRIPRDIARRFGSCNSRRNSVAPSSPWLTPTALIPAFTPKSEDRPKPSPTICARWRGWECPSLQP